VSDAIFPKVLEINTHTLATEKRIKNVTKIPWFSLWSMKLITKKVSADKNMSNKNSFIRKERVKNMFFTFSIIR
jgi:hypothetical protein